MYEDYLEEFIFKTAKLIAKKLFGKFAGEKEADVVEDEPSTSATVDTNVNTDQVTDESKPNEEEESNVESMNDEGDENEFEVLDGQKVSDAVVENGDDYGEHGKKSFFFLICLKT